MKENEIGTLIITKAIELHRDLGPGLLESVYELILAQLLLDEGLVVERQVPISIRYRGKEFLDAFRADLLVGGKVIVELKSVEKLSESHKKQIQTYLRLTGCRLGYLLNFGEAFLRDGILRAVNGLDES